MSNRFKIGRAIDGLHQSNNVALSTASTAVENLLPCVDAEPIPAAAHRTRLANIIVLELPPKRIASPREFILNPDRALARPMSRTSGSWRAP
jgi:hypothetical protein